MHPEHFLLFHAMFNRFIFLLIHSLVFQLTLSPEPEYLSGDNVEEELARAEREFLEARATYSVRRKAAETILMTDPILKAVHLKAATPPERYATLSLIRPDVS